MHFVKSFFNLYNELHSTVSRSLLFFYYTFRRVLPGFSILFSLLLLSVGRNYRIKKPHTHREKENFYFSFWSSRTFMGTVSQVLFIMKQIPSGKEGFFFIYFYNNSKCSSRCLPFIGRRCRMLFTLAWWKSFRLLFLIGGHVHLCLLIFLFFCSLVVGSVCVPHIRYFNFFFTVLFLSRIRSSYSSGRLVSFTPPQNPCTLCILDNVCLFHVRAFNIKNTKHNFLQTTWETCWFFFLLFIFQFLLSFARCCCYTKQ